LEDAIDKLSSTIGAKIMTEWGFAEEFVQVSSSWRELSVLPEQLGYLDFVRVGAALSGQLDNQKDAVMNLAIMRNMVSDIKVFDTDEFKDMRENGKAIFA
jgi:HD-like signal output (HDOD) protein